MTFGGIDEIVKKLEEENKNFCFIYLGHYCNWEWIASLPYWHRKIYCADKYTTRYTTKPSTGSSFACATSSAANASR